MNAIYAACVVAAASLGEMPDDKLRASLCDASKAIEAATAAGDQEQKIACYDTATKIMGEIKRRGLALAGCAH